LQPERDVLPHGHVLERGVMLEDESHASFLWSDARHVLALENDLALVGSLEPGDHAQQRRLAASARPEECGQRSGGDIDGNPVESREVTETLNDPMRLDHRVSSFGFSIVIKRRVDTAINASTTAEAYAPPSSNDWSGSCTYRVKDSVLPASRPDTTLTAPNSPSA